MLKYLCSFLCLALLSTEAQAQIPNDFNQLRTVGCLTDTDAFSILEMQKKEGLQASRSLTLRLMKEAKCQFGDVTGTFVEEKHILLGVPWEDGMRVGYVVEIRCKGDSPETHLSLFIIVLMKENWT
jgi:hypothetical protein